MERRSKMLIKGLKGLVRPLGYLFSFGAGASAPSCRTAALAALAALALAVLPPAGQQPWPLWPLPGPHKTPPSEHFNAHEGPYNVLKVLKGRWSIRG